LSAIAVRVYGHQPEALLITFVSFVDRQTGTSPTATEATYTADLTSENEN
jgi:hypothetical protein